MGPPPHDRPVAPLRPRPSLSLRLLGAAAAGSRTTGCATAPRAGQRGHRRSTGPYPRATTGPVGGTGTTITTPRLDAACRQNDVTDLPKTIDEEVIFRGRRSPVADHTRPSTVGVYENSGLGVRNRRNTQRARSPMLWDVEAERRRAAVREAFGDVDRR